MNEIDKPDALTFRESAIFSKRDAPCKFKCHSNYVYLVASIQNGFEI